MPAHSTTPARGWLARVHSGLGLLVAGFAFFHAFQNYPALRGSEAWVDRMHSSALGWMFGWIVIAAIGAHALLGLVAVVRARSAVAHDPAARDRGLGFQFVTGLFVLGFVAYHVIQLWPGPAGAHASVREPYARLWSGLGEPVAIVVYSAGVSALGFHFGHGLYRMLARIDGRGAPIVGRALGSVLGFVLLFVFVQIMARFALGEALIPALS
jgi:succinate dehydrogenase/fumarate reductase cytochrome b subunit